MRPAFKVRDSGKTSTRGKGFRRCYYRNGVLTIEHIRGTQRVFFSFDYQADAWRVSQIKQMRQLAAATRSSDERRLQIGQMGAMMVRKERRGESLHESWEIRRLRVGRIGNKETWREMDGRSFDSNEWQRIAQGGVKKVQKWIDKQMRSRSCVVVLIGYETADRDWINYEIAHAWSEKKGLLGVYIHNLAGNNQLPSQMGQNPFDYVSTGERRLSEIVRVYNPPFNESKQVYDYIRRNLDSWIEEAIAIRSVN